MRRTKAERSLLGFTAADQVTVPLGKSGKSVPTSAPKGFPRTPADVKLLLIPIHLIRPYKDQPRKYFDFEELKGLAESMKENGQEDVISVHPITDGQYKFELINGERRLRAAKMVGETKILALVRKVASEDEQFIRSVVANFCRSGHTHIETAQAAKRVCDYYSSKGLDTTRSVEKAAKTFGHSIAWVWQYLGLLRLCSEVQEMMEEGEISFQIGVALTNFKEEEQTRIANYIASHGFGHSRALNCIRLNRDEKLLTDVARIRRPSDDYNIFLNFLKRLGRDSEMIFDTPFKKFQDMFRNRPSRDLDRAIKILGQRAESLREVQETLEEIRKKENRRKIKNTSINGVLFYF